MKDNVGLFGKALLVFLVQSASAVAGEISMNAHPALGAFGIIFSSSLKANISSDSCYN